MSINTDTLVQALETAVKRHCTDGLLLSGGLDTSILAALSSKWQKPYCVTVALKGAPSPDIEFAKKVAALFSLKHHIHYFGEEELEEGIEAVIKILGTFDPMEVRNSAACYIALKVAGDKGLTSVMTGDGGDELFAGYSFFFELTKEQLAAELSKMWANMSFSSLALAGNLGIEVCLPFLDPVIKTLAANLDSGLLINRKNGQTFGKWILRQAFEGILPSELVWRSKAPLEVGSGTATLPSFFDAVIPDSYFARKKADYFREDRVTIRTKEHLHYYEIFRRTLGIPHLSAAGGRKCPECGGRLKENTAYCRICGAYPIKSVDIDRIE